MESLDIETDWKIIKENGNSKEAYEKVISYEINKLYKDIENNKYAYLQKLKSIRALDPSKNWKEFYDLVKALCNACVAKAFTDFKPKPIKSHIDKPEKSDCYGSMTFITLAAR